MAPNKLTLRSLLTIEPVLFFWSYGLFMSLPIMNQYVYSRISDRYGFPYNLTRKPGCAITNDSVSDALEIKVQDTAARFDIGNVMMMSVPSVIMSLMIGPWTDTGGRKRAIVAPVVGSLLEAINALLIMYLVLPIPVLFIGSAISGFCGFFTVMTQAGMSYIADTTPEGLVALRLAIMQLMLLIGGLISQLTSGVWLTTYGFIPPYWFIFACELAALVHLFFFVPESVPKTKKKKVRFFSCDSFKVIWRVYRDPRDGYRQSLALLLLGDGIVSLATMGLSGVIILYVLRSPLCWSPTILGGFMAFRFLTQGVGGILGIGILRRFISDSNVARVGLVSLIASLIVFAFANKTWIVFLVPLVGILTGTISPIMKGMITQLTRPDERGAAFSAVAAISTFCNFLGAFVFNPIYIKSINFDFPGLVFLICALVTVFPLAIFSFLKNPKYLNRDSETETSVVDKSPGPEGNPNGTELLPLNEEKKPPNEPEVPSDPDVDVKDPDVPSDPDVDVEDQVTRM